MGILLGAIAKVRNAAMTTTSKNNLRQIALATHHFVAYSDDLLPALDGNQRGPALGKSVLGSLVPFVDGGQEYLTRLKNRPADFRLGVYLSPADPSVLGSPNRGAGLSSYAPNGAVFLQPCRFGNSFTDGTSNTILIAEHYAYDCQQYSFWYGMTTYGFDRRASFADDGDIRPVTHGNPPRTQANLFSLTFQTAPRKEKCNPLIAQTPHPEGMLVALADGSVKQIRPTIDPHIYWAAVTPAAGEVSADAW
jgi:hypothetical protein